MGRFDQRDPGQDPLYTDGLDPHDVDTDAVETSPDDIAVAIERNCAAYFAGRMDGPTWDREQLRLWGTAAHYGVIVDVMKLVAPALGETK